jgi:hypothetical protein
LAQPDVERRDEGDEGEERQRTRERGNPRERLIRVAGADVRDQLESVGEVSTSWFSIAPPMK